jgi:uncharacterized membrane protein YgcG
MRLIEVTAVLFALLLSQPAFAQEWTEYVNKVDRFSVPAPGEPASETITWDSEYGAKFPGRVYRWTQGPNRYAITVVDFSDAEKIHAAINHTAYVGGVGYWVIDIAASVAHAARLYREKPGVKVTYDAFHYVNLITGHMLQLTNPDASRSYVAIYLHENRLYVLDATVAKGQPPPLIFQQSFAMLGPDGNTIRYQSLYYNRFPERQLGGRGGRGGGGGAGDGRGGAGDAGRGGAPPQGGQGRQ